MKYFPTLSYSSISEMPTLSYTWGLKRVPFSNGTSLWLAILGSTPLPPTPVGEMEKTDLMRLPMAFPFFFSFYRMHMLTCYPSYINYQMPLCCSLSLLSSHKYKTGVVIGLWDRELKFSRCSNSFQLSRVRKPECSLDFLKLITKLLWKSLTTNNLY